MQGGSGGRNGPGGPADHPAHLEQHALDAIDRVDALLDFLRGAWKFYLAGESAEGRGLDEAKEGSRALPAPRHLGHL